MGWDYWRWRGYGVCKEALDVATSAGLQLGEGFGMGLSWKFAQDYIWGSAFSAAVGGAIMQYGWPLSAQLLGA